MPRPSDLGYFQIALRGEEPDYPLLIDVSSFLYDFNLLYEFSCIVVDPKYARYRFNRTSSYRNAKRLLPEDRLEIQSLHLGSPIELVTVAAAAPAIATAFWLLVQTLEKVANFRINRDILKLQREKLRREMESLPADETSRKMLEDDTAIQEQIRIREAEYYFDSLARRLERNSIRVIDIEINRVRELPKKK